MSFMTTTPLCLPLVIVSGTSLTRAHMTWKGSFTFLYLLLHYIFHGAFFSRLVMSWWNCPPSTSVTALVNKRKYGRESVLQFQSHVALYSFIVLQEDYIFIYVCVCVYTYIHTYIIPIDDSNFQHIVYLTR